MPEFVGIVISKKLPATAVVDSTYRIEGTVKLLDALGAPPFVYARVKRKEWYKPEVAEETSFERGWPEPLSGDFSVDFKPEKEGDYQVTVVATPAPIALPAVGVFPVLAESDVMKVAVGQKPPAVFRFSGVSIDGNKVTLSNHDADSNLLIQKKTSDSIEITPSYEWVGPKKSAVISVKAGYKDYLGNFTPKTDAYTQVLELPESPDTVYSGVAKAPIKVPLAACGDLSDGAIEIVAKLPDMDDYISQIWNAYRTSAPVVNFRFSDIIIDGNAVSLPDHDTDSGLLLPKTTADSLSINPAFEWQGPRKSATISIKAGYKSALGFEPKTAAYTRNIELPESIEKIYPGQLTSPIAVPLTACGGLTDGAIEVVLKISGVPDYITHIWNVYNTKEAEEEIAFDLTRPTASPSQVAPGATVTITCPVTSRSTKVQSVTAKFLIYEGSIYAGHGSLLDTKSVSFSISPGQTYNASVSHTSIAGTIDRRDVEVEIYVGGELVKESEWDDIFYVTAAEVIDFDLSTPTASPSQVDPGATVTITCPVTSRSTKVQSVTAKFLIYEGSIYAGHGSLLDTKSVSFSISPGQTYNASVSHTSVAGTIDRRDVSVQIILSGQVVAEDEWDDVFYVKAIITPPKADIRNLAFEPTKGTYKIGDYVPFSLSYEYRGKAQSGQLVLSVGTGVYPTFFTTQEYNPMAVSFPEAMDWVSKSLSGSRFVLTSALEPGKTYNTRAKLETLEDLTEETDTDWSVITIASVEVGVNFQVAIWGVPDFGTYQKWCCYYWDPGIGDFVGDRKWYNSYDKISFNNVQPGGYLAVFLMRDSTVSSQYTSPIFSPVSGGSYTYDVQMGVIYG
jgi:archaellum component FlaF (FlaF/FlaG flagellin family)